MDDYIPPCTRLNSHRLLIEKYEEFDAFLNNLKNDSFKIIEKIRNKRRNREQNDLADDIDALCQQYADHFVRTYDEFKLCLVDQPPLYLVAFFARMARVLNHSLDMAINKGHLLQYFHQYATNVSAAQLEQIIRRVFESNYFHYDISQSLMVIDEFLSTFNEIFQSLVKLDYRELAPRNVVKRDIISDVNQDMGRETSSRTIKIKHTGKEKFLGDDLE